MERNKEIVISEYGKHYLLFELSDKAGNIFVDIFIEDSIGGWMWRGNETDFLTFLNRVYKSKVADEFKKEWEKAGLNKYINKLINIAIDNDDFYSILGDNRLWFEGIWLYNYFDDLLKRDGIDERKDAEEYDYYFDNMPFTYEELAPYIIKSDYIQDMIPKLRSIKSIDEFYNLMDEFSLDDVIYIIYDLIEEFYISLKLSREKNK